MKIGLDISQINRDNAGINHYIKEILPILASQFPQHEYLVFLRKQENLPIELPANFQQIIIPQVPKWLGGGLTWYLKLAFSLRKNKAEALINFTMNISSLSFWRSYTILYDMIPLTHPDRVEKGTAWRFKLAILVTRYFAKRILAISNYSAKEFKRYFPRYKREITIINSGLNKWLFAEYSSKQAEEIYTKYNLTKPYLLSVGTVQPRKNYPATVEAFKESGLAEDFDYVIIGRKGWGYDELTQKIAELGMQNHVKILTTVDDTELRTLYHAAQCCVLTSFEEGFGMPAIEAYACGLPLVLSNIEVFRELAVGDATIFVEPTQTKSMAQGLTKAAKMSKHYVSPRFLEQYSWQTVTQKLLNALEN